MQGKITKKQKAVYDYICQYIDLNDYSPTQKSYSTTDTTHACLLSLVVVVAAEKLSLLS